MQFKQNTKKVLNAILAPFEQQVINKKQLVDFYLYEYDSYEQYKEVQIFHNLRKINNIWADETTLTKVSEVVRELCKKTKFKGLCHGTRNGFEQSFMSSIEGFDVIGTDISSTASEYERSYEWDFHNENDKWVNKFDFVYSNSLDQAWKPRKALTCWLNQIHEHGLVIIEHTDNHGPMAASEMDPFGVRPMAMPYVLSDWFGHQVSLSITTTTKSNIDKKAWLFILKKNVKTVK